MHNPFLPLSGVREDILMRNTLLNYHLACFNLPKCINAGNYCEGEKEEEDKKQSEKNEPHRFFVNG